MTCADELSKIINLKRLKPIYRWVLLNYYETHTLEKTAELYSRILKIAGRKGYNVFLDIRRVK
jgi:hypothetical protein